MKVFGGIIVLLLNVSVANAGFDSWTADTNDDPFKGGEVVTASYVRSARSGVFVECNSTSGTVILKAIAGWAYQPGLELIKPDVKYAIDGNVVEITGEAATGAYGDNIAGISVNFEKIEARKLVESFARAKKQIAINDGISDSPFLLSARGSTAAGKKLIACIDKIKVEQNENNAAALNAGSSKSAEGVDSISVDLTTPEGIGYAQTAWSACIETHDYATRQVKATVAATAMKHITENFAKFKVGQEDFNRIAATDIEEACEEAVDKKVLIAN